MTEGNMGEVAIIGAGKGEVAGEEETSQGNSMTDPWMFLMN